MIGASIGKYGMPIARESFTIWYVCIPMYQDRAEYVRDAYITGVVSVVNDNGEYSTAKVGRLSLQLIEFPVNDKTYGSEVACLCNSYSGQLYIVDVFNNSGVYLPQDESQYRLIKQNEDGIASISIDGNGNIVIDVNGSDENGSININCTTEGRKGKLNVTVNGDILIQNDGTTSLKSTQQVLIDAPKVLLADGAEEPILLGQKVVEFLSDWLDQLAKESAGPYPLLGQATYTQMKQKLEELKSQISFVK